MTSKTTEPTNGGPKINSRWRTSLSADGPWSTKTRYSIPITERLTQLYAFGYDVNTIIGILREEFQDIEVNNIDKDQITGFIADNKLVLEQAKEEFRTIVHEEILVHTREVIAIVAKGENKAVTGLANKLDQISKNIENIDLSEVDENGKPIHMSVFFQNLEAMERVMKLLGKYSGTDDLRGLATLKSKLSIQAEFEKEKGNSLIPTGNGMRNANAGSKPTMVD